MNNSTKQTGKDGEDRAAQYLQNLGHTILERNWRYKHLEIDIISYQAGVLHFVEVKTRVAPLAAPPQDSLTSSKMANICKAALIYMKGIRYLSMDIARTYPEIQIDAICVVKEIDNNYTLNYYPRVYMPVRFYDK